MQPDGPSSPHLTYCTNIHPGESWQDVRDNFDKYKLPIRDLVSPNLPFGVGLRLAAAAAEELSRPEELAEFRSFLIQNGLYIFTLNGFPYGPFHGQPVKENVYLPNWMQDERLEYTNLLADLLRDLLPDEIDGTVSTVPGAFAPLVTSPEEVQRMAAQMARHAVHLHRIREESGKWISLALEPEPCCHLETIDETVTFFQRDLFGDPAIQVAADELGLSPAAAEQVLRDHLTVCFDACHMAVEFEEPADALQKLRSAGIRVGKYQISAGLRVEFSGEQDRDAELRAQLREFADPVYLHQVVEQRQNGEIRRFLDLPEALEAAADDRTPREWRIHFHVPLFREELGPFQSTQPYLREMIQHLEGGDDDQHWEVETYTWDVLPEEFRNEEVATAVAREIGWVADQIRSARR